MASIYSSVGRWLLMASVIHVTMQMSEHEVYEKIHGHANQMQQWKWNTRNSINSLYNRASVVEDDIIGLHKRLDDLTSELSLHFTQLDNMAELLLEGVQSMAGNSSIPSSYEAPGVAFQAFMELGSTLLYDKTVPIKYSQVTLNEGDAYNHTTGFFTVPSDGLYYLHSSFRDASLTTETKAEMKVYSSNGTFLRTLCHFHSYYSTSITSILAMLETGTKVGMFITDHSSGSTGSSAYQLLYENTFTGYQVAEVISNDTWAPPPSTPDSTTVTSSSLSSADVTSTAASSP